MKGKERLRELVEILRKSKISEPNFVADKFCWVFGNLIQEYLADMIYEEIRDTHDIGKIVELALENARNLFGKNPQNDWPFHTNWLIKYTKSRYLGERRGTLPEDDRRGNIRKFMEKYPRDQARCQWYLGCELRDNLTADHRWPWSLHGSSRVEDFQWLCAKHNNSWKKNLLLWDCFIPFRDFSETDMRG
ncbi:MAG: HNH endonuclease [Candidatus Thorarchaeota archaeon]